MCVWSVVARIRASGLQLSAYALPADREIVLLLAVRLEERCRAHVHESVSTAPALRNVQQWSLSSRPTDHGPVP